MKTKRLTMNWPVTSCAEDWQVRLRRNKCSLPMHQRLQGSRAQGCRVYEGCYEAGLE